MTDVDARQAIENLRSGVPSRHIASRYPYGRQDLLRSVEDDLALLEKNGAGKHLRLLCAAYGNGKSHALQAIWRLAESRNWIVSFISLSRETPLNRLDQVYRKLAANTYLPESDQPGIQRLFETIRGSDADELRIFADANLHPKLQLVIENIFYGASTELLHQFFSDLTGELLTVSDLRKLSEINYWSPRGIQREHRTKLRPFNGARDIADYFRLMNYVCSTCGKSGWLVLIDELELIGALGPKSRMRAYQNLLRLATDSLLEHAYIVTALAQSYVEEVIPKDTGIIANLRYRGEDELATDAERMSQLISEEQRTSQLAPLNRDELVSALKQVIHDHEAAYEWSAPISAEELYTSVIGILQTEHQLRNIIRGAIQWLDITMQYGRPPTRFHVGIAAEQRPAIDDEDDGENVLPMADSENEEIATDLLSTVRRRNLLTGEMA